MNAEGNIHSGSKKKFVKSHRINFHLHTHTILFKIDGKKMRLDQLTKPRLTNWSGSSRFSRTENSPGPSTLLLNPTSTTSTAICFHDSHMAFLLYSNIIKDVKCHNTHLKVQQIISSPFFLLTRVSTSQIFTFFSSYFLF